MHGSCECFGSACPADQISFLFAQKSSTAASAWDDRQLSDQRTSTMRSGWRHRAMAFSVSEVVVMTAQYGWVRERRAPGAS